MKVQRKQENFPNWKQPFCPVRYIQTVFFFQMLKSKNDLAYLIGKNPFVINLSAKNVRRLKYPSDSIRFVVFNRRN